MFDRETSEGRKLYGKYPGIVVANEASEEHLGIITVRVPAILEEGSDGQPVPIEVLARPCLPPRFFFLPEVEDRVWVEFAAGDIDSPIWSGVWYPSEQPPKTDQDEAPTEKQRVLRTGPEGHVLTFDDDAKTIAVLDAHGNRVQFSEEVVSVTYTKDDKNTLIELASDHLKIQHHDKASIELTADHVLIQFDSDNTVKLSADGIELNGTSVTVTADEVKVVSDAVELG